jgi:hypothetical protein
LRPIKQTARRAGCRGTEDHEINLVLPNRLVNILSFDALFLPTRAHLDVCQAVTDGFTLWSVT